MVGAPGKQDWRARRRRLSRFGRVLGAFFRHNLRARVALGLGLPILLPLSLLSLAHYWRERHLLTDQARLSAEQIGQAQDLIATLKSNQ